MARRRSAPASIREVLVEAARRIAPWPTGDAPGPSVVDQALAGDAPPIRRSASRRSEP